MYGTPEPYGLSGLDEWRSWLARVTGRDRPGAQRRRCKGPRLLESRPARGGSPYCGRSYVPRFVESPSCRRISRARRSIRASGDHVRSVERGRQRAVELGKGKALATPSSRPMRRPVAIPHLVQDVPYTCGCAGPLIPWNRGRSHEGRPRRGIPPRLSGEDGGHSARRCVAPIRWRLVWTSHEAA